jgi:uncharacterized protein YbcC (UPF0753/DUF2309 family)
MTTVSFVADMDLAAEIEEAARPIAPLWPLTEFVAVNPLLHLADLPFPEAAAVARRWLGGRTHLSTDELLALHRSGEIGLDDLETAAAARYPWLVSEPRLGEAEVLDVVVADLLDTERRPSPPLPRTVAERHDLDHGGSIAAHVRMLTSAACAVHASGASPAADLFGSWKAAARHDPGLLRLVGAAGRAWIRALPDRAEDAVETCLDTLDIGLDHRIDELRGHLARLPGWSGHARWRSEWASPEDPAPRMSLVDLLAVSLSLEAACRIAGRLTVGDRAPISSDPSLPRRTARILAELSLPQELGPAVEHLLERCTDQAGVWLGALERSVRRPLVAAMARPRPALEPPATQLVFCIDVRSERLRRHLEAVGAHETFGVAGFFGIPMRWRPAGSTFAEARTPAPVEPRFDATEEGDASGETTRRIREHRRHVGSSLGKGPGSSFAFAEIAGWLAGPVAAARTLWPSRRPKPSIPGAGEVTVWGSLADRAGAVEGLLRSIGLVEDFAPLVVLCGHAAQTTNNLHASGLDCGACGGAPGGANARAAAALLNDAAVRRELATSGITIPDETVFVGAVHETAGDEITLLDPVPGSHRDLADQLVADLATAGAGVAAERAAVLGADPTIVRSRGRDWAEPRPEAGLAGNAAFVIGPRSATRECDLRGRVFLHSYDQTLDPSGAILGGILAGPVAVAQWISAQYAMSTTDPEVFGAGDKQLHNPIAGVGVLSGDGGDLRVGLPLQSVRLPDHRLHDPVRLLVVIHAPRSRIDAALLEVPGVGSLVRGEWIHVVAVDEGIWWERRPEAGWVPWDLANVRH